MNKSVKSLITYSLITVLIFIIYFVFQLCNNSLISKDIKDKLYDYFKNNSNTHISSHSFSIENINILCKGDNAYIVEFDIYFEDNSNVLKELGAMVYEEKDTWKVKSFVGGINMNELNLYNFRCYDKKE